METKLNYVHICDLAFISQGGKANIIGIFKSIYSDDFPVSHPKFSLIASFIVNNGIGNHKQLIKIIDKNNKQLGKEIELDLNIKEISQEVNFICDVINIVFEKPDVYSVKIFLDDIEVCSVPLEVAKV